MENNANLYNKVSYLENMAHIYHLKNDRLASFYYSLFLIYELELNAKSKIKYQRHF